MGKKRTNILLLFESNRSRIVEAAIKSNFLEQLKVNEGCAFNYFLSSIYKGNFTSKQCKENKLRNLKALWKKNKELLTKEINEVNFSFLYVNSDVNIGLFDLKLNTRSRTTYQNITASIKQSNAK